MANNRTTFASGAKWEELVGYSRAVRVGNTVEVTGTVAVDEHGHVAGRHDHYQQTKFILQKIDRILHQAGAALKDVTRTRMFVTDISKWQEYGRAHAEVFRTIRPCTTMVEVSKLISPEFLIEIEATAVIAEERAEP
ncbi:MAG: RidA family protein [Bacteroidetes bacterium]|nr:MAG: RidA family protein [Bacteroidota bacterium]